MKTINSQQQESQQIPSTRCMKKITPRYIRINLIKTRDKKKFKAAKLKNFYSLNLLKFY